MLHRQLTNLVDFQNAAKRATFVNIPAPAARAAAPWPRRARRGPRGGGPRSSEGRSASSGGKFGKLSAEVRSFSAVSAPIFARKYAFSSIFQHLPDYLAESFEIWQNFADSKYFATIAKFSLNFHESSI